MTSPIDEIAFLDAHAAATRIAESHSLLKTGLIRRHRVIDGRQLRHRLVEGPDKRLLRLSDAVVDPASVFLGIK